MVENYFEEYRDRLNAHTSDKLQEMLQYYERVWINGYTPTRYFVGSLVNKTNNLVEADNKQLKSDIKTHPNLIDFIGMLQWYHIVERIINYLFFIYSERLKKRNSIKEREYLDAKGNRAVRKSQSREVRARASSIAQTFQAFKEGKMEQFEALQMFAGISRRRAPHQQQQGL